MGCQAIVGCAGGAVEPDVTARLGAYAPLLQRDGEPGARKGGTGHLVRDADGRRGPPVGQGFDTYQIALDLDASA